ncbi:MAG: trypsin-like peptidase domain-containing protein [Luteolibacter sp.]
MPNNFFAICISIVFISNSALIARPPENIEEALACTFFVTSYGKDGKPFSAGTAFLATDGDIQWIYSNAHVIDGASRIEISDQKGNILKGFGKFACYATGSGDVALPKTPGSSINEKIRYGGDGIRLELKQKREFAFQVHDKSLQVASGIEVITIGDNDGDKKMDVLEGEITAFSEKVVLTTCATKPGSSGGVLLDKSTMKVIGLNTWGLSGKSQPVDLLWQPSNKAEKTAGSSILSQASWVEISAAEFLKGAEHAKRFKDAVKLLTLIYVSTPTKSGFTLDYDNEIASGVSLADAYDQLAWNTILRPVADLNKRLGRAKGSNIQINNMEVVGTYATAIQKIREEYFRFSNETKNKIPPYYRNDLANHGFYDIGDHCYEQIEHAQKWFDEKSSAGGVMPVGKWINLPPLSSFASIVD